MEADAGHPAPDVPYAGIAGVVIHVGHLPLGSKRVGVTLRRGCDKNPGVGGLDGSMAAGDRPGGSKRGIYCRDRGSPKSWQGASAQFAGPVALCRPGPDLQQRQPWRTRPRGRAAPVS